MSDFASPFYHRIDAGAGRIRPELFKAALTELRFTLGDEPAVIISAPAQKEIFVVDCKLVRAEETKKKSNLDVPWITLADFPSDHLFLIGKLGRIVQVANLSLYTSTGSKALVKEDFPEL